jgi:Mn2+/Fe2+ NRAMP family transporter
VSNDNPDHVAVINGVLAPPLLVLIMIVSNNNKIMGNRVNARFTNFVGRAAAVIMFAAAIGMFATWQ